MSVNRLLSSASKPVRGGKGVSILADLGFNSLGRKQEKHMAARTKSPEIALVIAAVMLLLAPSAYAQGKKSHSAPPTENKPKVDEKAYKAALDRIPTPKKPYDPWGQVHDAEPAKPPGKTN
jgi:hypothetical protein